MLLQFSTNFAQGPFQGYVPDLVPARQVGLASALVGLIQILGNVVGFAIGALAIVDRAVRARPDRRRGRRARHDAQRRRPRAETGRRRGRARVDRGARSPRRPGGPTSSASGATSGCVASRLLVLMAGGVAREPRRHLPADVARADAGGSRERVTVVIAARGRGHDGRDRPVGPDLRPGRAEAGDLRQLALGAVSGWVIAALAPTPGRGRRRRRCSAARQGMFLAVDWALMTDIIPKASSGRYMGMTNVATASSGVLAVAIGGTLMDLVGGPASSAAGRARRSSWLASCAASGRCCCGRSSSRDGRTCHRGRSRRWPRRSSRPERSVAESEEPRTRAIASGGPPGDRVTDSVRRRSETARPPVREAIRQKAGRSQSKGSLPAPQPRDERPQQDEVVEPDRPAPEPEQRLELRRSSAAASRGSGATDAAEPDEAPGTGPRREDEQETARDPLHPGRERPQQAGRAAAR